MADDLRGAFEAYRETPLGPGDRPSTEELRRRGRRWLWRRRSGAVLLSAALVGAVMLTGQQLDELRQPDEPVASVATSSVPSSTPTSAPPTTTATTAASAAAPGSSAGAPPSSSGSTTSTAAAAPTTTTQPERTTRQPTTTVPFVKQPLRILRPAAGATVTEATIITVEGQGCFPGSVVLIGISLDGSPDAEPIGRGAAAADGTFSVQARIPEMGFDVMPETRLRVVCDQQTVFSPIVVENA